MKANAAIPSWNAIVSSGLGLVALLLVVAVVAGWQAPFIAGASQALLALTAIGFLMCSVGMSKVATGLGWTHPITLIGIVLGAGVLLLAVLLLTGVNWPWLPDPRLAFGVVAAAIAVKWALARASRVFLRA